MFIEEKEREGDEESSSFSLLSHQSELRDSRAQNVETSFCRIVQRR